MRGSRLGASAAGDADGERKNPSALFEGEGISCEGEDAGRVDGEELFVVAFGDGIVKSFTRLFLIIAGGLIVDIEDGVAIVGGTFDGVIAVVVSRAE